MPLIVPIAVEHEARWRELYRSYATFYGRELTDAHAGTVWDLLMDPGHELEGRLALVDGRPVGLAHFRRMPSPLRGADIGFLDDLFVEPETRAKGIGRALIEAVADIARERGWSLVRWVTADDNYRARTLYDRLAVETTWNLYELAV